MPPRYCPCIVLQKLLFRLSFVRRQDGFIIAQRNRFDRRDYLAAFIVTHDSRYAHRLFQAGETRVVIVQRGDVIRAHPAKMLEVGVTKLEALIKDCGLYKSKAKNLIATCHILVEQYHGEVPREFDQLVELPGVGRKTANVVVSVLFGTPAIAVDTHVFRVANRLKLGIAKTPEEMEQKLQKAIPKEKWSAAHHWLIYHGRRVCKARKPLCETCFLHHLCPSAGKV